MQCLRYENEWKGKNTSSVVMVRSKKFTGEKIVMRNKSLPYDKPVVVYKILGYKFKIKKALFRHSDVA